MNTNVSGAQRAYLYKYNLDDIQREEKQNRRSIRLTKLMTAQKREIMRLRDVVERQAKGY